MRLRRILACILFLASLAGSLSFLCEPRVLADNIPQSSLRFFQSIAVSDFDGDGRVDRALLRSPGSHHSIEILLSATGKSSLIQFDTASAQDGSLYAGDVDSDGDIDLVWTNLLHNEDVLVWLGDGSGRFELVCPHAYLNEFVINAAGSVHLPSATTLELAASSPRAPETDCSVVEAKPQIDADELTPNYDRVAAASSIFLSNSPGRAPPQQLS